MREEAGLAVSGHNGGDAGALSGFDHEVGFVGPINLARYVVGHSGLYEQELGDAPAKLF